MPPPPGRPRAAKALSYAKNLAFLLMSGLVLYLFDVHNVMWRSTKIYRTILNMSYLCHSVFVVIGLYLSLVVERYNPNWGETHKQYIYVATGAVVLGGTLWTIALTPVFHLWMFPLAFAALIFCVTLVTLIPSPTGKVATE